MQQFGRRGQGQVGLAAVGARTHHIAHGVAQHLVHLLVPLKRIAQVDHRIQQHHVGACIEAAFAHHQILLGELTDQRTLAIHHRQTADVVVAHQLNGLLQGALGRDREHRG